MSEGLVRLDVPGHGVFLAMAGMGATEIAEAIRLHRSAAESGASILKKNLGTLVTCVRLGSPPRGVPADIAVKEVPRRRPLFTLKWGIASRSCRDFEVHQRLAALGIAAPQPIACTLRPSGATEVSLSELVPDSVPLRDLLWLGDRVIRSDREREILFERLGPWLRDVHEKGVWQRDLKPSNVLVRAGGFVLVDITDVRIRRRPLDPVRRQRNLAQLLDLTPDLDGERRLPLLRSYLGERDAAALESWGQEVDRLIELRRDYRQSQSGFRYVDEEHFRRPRPGPLL